MLIIEDNFNNILNFPTYICLGSFDGLHLGHMELIYKTIENAKKNNCKSMIYTFANHPLSIINKNKVPKLIINNNAKIKILKKVGVDIVNLVSFDKSFMAIQPDEFIRLLVKHYNAKGLIVGFNYRFGYKNKGDITLLKKLSKEYEFQLDVIAPVKMDKQIVSSTNIRELLKEGKVEKANKLLYESFSLEGRVIEGKKLGHKLGFPTINLFVDEKSLIPQNGIYYTITYYNNRFYKSMTNIGFCPTVNGKKLAIETYILNFNQKIYGETVKILFIKKIRNEIKFETIENLINQLNKDRNFVEKQKNILV